MSTFIVNLDRYTYGGEAMGRLEDGRAVFVPFAIPGESVRLQLVEDKRNFARGEILEVLQPAPNRIEARCPHFSICGGCHYQHIAYPDQLAAKEEILQDQLARIGKIENPPVRAIVPSPNPWHYRNHIQFHLTEDGQLSFVDVSSTALVPISECHLPDENLSQFWQQLDFDPGTPDDRISLRSGSGGDLMLVIESEEKKPPEIDFEAGISAVHVFSDNPVVMAGDDHLVIEVLQRLFKVSALSFFQVNIPVAEQMIAHILELLPEEVDILLDVYCGVGLFSAFTAPRAKRVIAIEASVSACEDFVTNLDDFDHIELYEASAESVLPALADQITSACIAIVDPPRAGLDRYALDALIQVQPQAIIYVSCDPSTLARDSKRLLENGYRLRQVTPFDMFPQTYHIESISLFQK